MKIRSTSGTRTPSSTC